MTSVEGAHKDVNPTSDSNEKRVFYVGHHESEILAELDNKRAMLDIHKNPLLVSILNSCEMLKALDEKGELPLTHLVHSRAIIFLKAEKVGFGISITQGYGLVIARAPHRPSGWSAPLPIKVDGFSVGAVMGFSSQDSIVCLANDDDINAFKAKKKAMKLGVDIGLSLMDKFDQHVGYDTQNMQSAEQINSRAFTINKGVLFDVAFKGVSVEADFEDIEASYGKSVSAADILNGEVSPPREVTILYNLLLNFTDRYSAPVK